MNTQNKPPTDRPALDAEAQAFNERISERRAAGFVPDLRHAVKCDYFYKSFWRDPHFARLYVGGYLDILLGFLRRFGRPGLRLLDAGCGPGYYSLEFARAGHHVTGIDIADKAIETARRTVTASPPSEGFGSLEYRVGSLETERETFDAVVFTGVIHHFADPDATIRRALELLPTGGLLLCLEPCHERWRQTDAAIVGLIRGLLSATGHWHEPQLAGSLTTPEAWPAYAQEIHTEYFTEKDAHERGQSPNDNASDGVQILTALRRHLVELDCQPGVSFIYRFLGGLRGPDEVVHPMADLIAAFDRFAVAEGHMQPNAFLFAGRKP